MGIEVGSHVGEDGVLVLWIHVHVCEGLYDSTVPGVWTS